MEDKKYMENPEEETKFIKCLSTKMISFVNHLINTTNMF